MSPFHLPSRSREKINVQWDSNWGRRLLYACSDVTILPGYFPYHQFNPLSTRGGNHCHLFVSSNIFINFCLLFLFFGLSPNPQVPMGTGGRWSRKDLGQLEFGYVSVPWHNTNLFIFALLNVVFFFAVTSNQQQHNPPLLPVCSNMVTNPSSEGTSADFRKQRAVLKKDLQRKFERWDKDPHDRTR